MRQMTSWIALCAVAMTAVAPAADKPRVGRASMVLVEQGFNNKFYNLGAIETLDLLGAARGVYLEGYGAVVTVEVNLVVGPAVSPFRPVLTKGEIALLKEKKRARLEVLKKAMRETLIAAGAALGDVPAQEQVVVGVSLFYFAWEDSAGLPGQILMRAPRGLLADHKAGRVNAAAMDAALRVEVF